jgi:AcrR family transcriptional regulator
MPQRRPRIRGVRPPQQDRSRDTYVRILDATECLLEDREFDAVRIEQVLSEARVSAGSFYSRFEGKEALLQALLSRYTEGVVELAGDGNRGAGVPPTLEARARAEVRHRIRPQSTRGCFASAFAAHGTSCEPGTRATATFVSFTPAARSPACTRASSPSTSASLNRAAAMPMRKAEASILLDEGEARLMRFLLRKNLGYFPPRGKIDGGFAWREQQASRRVGQTARPGAHAATRFRRWCREI